MQPIQLKELADAEFDRVLHRKNLRETAMAQLMVPFAGGLFLARIELMSFLATHPSETVCVEDAYNNPILANRVELLSLLRDSYDNAMRKWHTDFQNSNRVRRASNV